MLKKRLLVLGVMLSLLVVVSVTESTSATAYCSCAVSCIGSGDQCVASCDGGTSDERQKAAKACCQEAIRATPVQCDGGGGVS